MVRPRDAGEVAEVMRACTRLGVPLTFRAGGTSLSGQAQSDGVLVDTRTAFQGVEVLDDGARVRVQPGVTVRAVNARLAPHRRRLGPDPASEGACTLGGVIATNSSGMQCGTERNTYRTLESLVAVLPSGTVVDTSRPDADRLLAETEPELHAGLLRLRDRVRSDPDSVATLERLFSIKNTMGYGLNALLDHDEPAEVLARLLVGSEGTLGFVASAVFRTVEVLPHAATGLLVFDDLLAASRAVPQVVAAGVATAELLDARSLRVAQADPAAPRAVSALDVADQAALLVELQAGGVDELEEARAGAAAALRDLETAAGSGVVDLTRDAAERAALWRTRKGLYSAVAGARPAGTSALLEDVAVPTDRLGALAEGLEGLFARHRYDSSVIFGHARDGNLHFLLNEDFASPALLSRYEAFTDDLVDLVLGLGGTLKAEHGTGRIMAPFVERQYGAELTDVMREVKALVDPAGVLNPGSVLTDDPALWLRDLKTALPVEEEVDRCVECGFCEPVCPSRTLTTTPRQRIVLRREMAAARARGGPEDLELLASLEADYTYDAVQTCASDGMCVTACPVLIDTGALTRRLRAEAEGPLEGRAWSAAAGRWSAVTRAGSAALTVADRLPPAVPVALTTAARRGAAGALGSPADGHELVPAYDEVLPRGGPPRPRLDDPAPQAVLFAACIGTLFGPDEPGQQGSTAALVELCRTAGVALRTPAGLADLCCGTPWKSKGHLGGWERIADQVVPALVAATDGGRLPVVVDASSCAEGLEVLVDRFAPAAGLEVVDAVTFVAEQVAPRLEVRRRVPRAVVHPTCSTTVLGSTSALVSLAGLAAEDVVVPGAWGCCAFAGDRGLLHPELTESATAAEAEEVAALSSDGPAGTVYVSANRTCELGMSRATGEVYRHVLEVLADAVC